MDVDAFIDAVCRTLVNLVFPFVQVYLARLGHCRHQEFNDLAVKTRRHQATQKFPSIALGVGNSLWHDVADCVVDERFLEQFGVDKGGFDELVVDENDVGRDWTCSEEGRKNNRDTSLVSFPTLGIAFSRLSLVWDHPSV